MKPHPMVTVPEMSYEFERSLFDPNALARAEAIYLAVDWARLEEDETEFVFLMGCRCARYRHEFDLARDRLAALPVDSEFGHLGESLRLNWMVGDMEAAIRDARALAVRIGESDAFPAPGLMACAIVLGRAGFADEAATLYTLFSKRATSWSWNRFDYVDLLITFGPLLMNTESK